MLDLRSTQPHLWPHPRGPRHKKTEAYRQVVPAYPNRLSVSRLPWKCFDETPKKWPCLHHDGSKTPSQTIRCLRSHLDYPLNQAWRRFQPGPKGLSQRQLQRFGIIGAGSVPMAS